MPIRPENRHRYGSDWSQFSDHIRHERAGGRCECRGECGRPAAHLAGDGRCPNRHGQPAHSTGTGQQLGLDGLPAPAAPPVVLTVAHRNHLPEQRDQDQVFAACQGCHLHHDIDHHRQTRQRTRTAERAAQHHLLFDDASDHCREEQTMPSTEHLREELDETRSENEVLRGEIEQLQRQLNHARGTGSRDGIAATDDEGPTGAARVLAALRELLHRSGWLRLEVHSRSGGLLAGRCSDERGRNCWWRPSGDLTDDTGRSRPDIAADLAELLRHSGWERLEAYRAGGVAAVSGHCVDDQGNAMSM